MSPELVLLLAGTGVALAIGVQHFYDRFAPRGLYRAARGSALAVQQALERMETTLGRVGADPAVVDTLKHFGELQEALKARSDDLPGAITEGVYQALNRVAAEQVAEATKTAHEAGLQLGMPAAADAKLERGFRAVVGQDLLGPYGAVLEGIAPNVYTWLREHPESIVWALQQPFIQGLLQKAQALFNAGQAQPQQGVHPLWKA